MTAEVTPIDYDIRIADLVKMLRPEQLRVYTYLVEYSLANGNFPTFRQIARNSHTVVSVAKYHIEKLAKLGLVKINDSGSLNEYSLAGLKSTIDYDTVVTVNSANIDRIIYRKRKKYRTVKNPEGI